MRRGRFGLRYWRSPGSSAVRPGEAESVEGFTVLSYVYVRSVVIRRAAADHFQCCYDGSGIAGAALPPPNEPFQR